jgi:gliding motility-associated protein GldM
MAIPKEPRQLMINLMYLVLTALLALNISNEILNAFKIINRSILKSNSVISNKNTGTLTFFQEALDGTKYTEAKKKRIATGLEWAKQVHAKSDSLVSVLEGFKSDIIAKSGGYLPEKVNGASVLKSPEDIDAATHYMVEEEKKGLQMQKVLADYKTEISKLVPKGDTMLLDGTVNDTLFSLLPISFEVDTTDENPKGDWSFGNFHHVPTIGAITVMEKYINDVKNSESIAMEHIWASATGEKDVKIKKIELPFTKYIPVISSKSTYLLPGEKYEAEVRIAAYNAKDNSTQVTINGSTYQLIDGVAKFSTIANKPDENKITIGGSYVDPNAASGGRRVALDPITTSFFVGQAQASVSLDKMNVFYIGVPNPITISASGVPLNTLGFRDNAGLSITKDGTDPGKYIVTPTLTSPGKASITLFGKKSDGTEQVFSKKEYRVKEIPDPTMYFGNKLAGRLEASRARLEFGPEPRLERFDFEATYKVVSFKLTISRAKGGGDLEEFQIKGPTFASGGATAEAAMKRLTPKDKIYFEELKVVGPDKKVRSIANQFYILF